MPIDRYQIRNVYSLADPELYKAVDKDDPEALLEGVAMAGLVGVLRQLGDLAEFAAEIFHDLHEEVMTTVARGHGLLARVQQLELEIPSIERALLSQTSHSTFFSNSGIDWHPNQQTKQNLIITGDLPRIVMNSYEECRGPPRLFLLDKFDVGGAGACLKRYSDPSIYKVEASSYDIGSAETQRDKKIHKTKKKGSRWKGAETSLFSQHSHVKLHQLFLEERVHTGAIELARRVKLRRRQKKFPFDSETGESYMNKLLNDEIPHPVNTSIGSRLEDDVMGSAVVSPVQSRSPRVAESQPSELLTSSLSFDAHGSEEEEKVDKIQRTIHGEITIYGAQNGDDVASDTDNYMDALPTMDSEHETEVENGPKTTIQRSYSDENKNLFPSQIPDSLLLTSPVSSDGNNSVDYDTSTSTENTSPPRLFACAKIPFHPRVTGKPISIAEKVSATQNRDLDITNDICADVRNVSSEIDSALHVDQVAFLEQSMIKEMSSSNQNENLDSPRECEESQHSDFLTDDSLSSFSFVRKIKDHVDSEDPYDTSTLMIHLPNALDTNENHRTVLVCSESNSPDSVISHGQEEEPDVIHDVKVEPGDTSHSEDVVTEEIAENPEIHSLPQEQLIQMGDGILHLSDLKEARTVSYSSGDVTELNNSEIGAVGGNEFSEETDLVERETDLTNTVSVPHDVDRNDDKVYVKLEYDTDLEGTETNSVNSEMETSAAVSLSVDVNKNEENGCLTIENSEDSKECERKEQVEILSLPVDVNKSDENSCLTLENNEDSKECEKKEQVEMIFLAVDVNKGDENSCFTLENSEDSKECEEKEQLEMISLPVVDVNKSDENNCFTLGIRDVSKESEEKEKVQMMSVPVDLKSSEENGLLTPENHEVFKEDDEKEEVEIISLPVDVFKSEKNGCFPIENRENFKEAEEKEQVEMFSLPVDVNKSDKNGGFTPDNLKDLKEPEEKEEMEMISLPVDVYNSEENGCFALENHEDPKESEEKEQVEMISLPVDVTQSEGDGIFTPENHEDSKHSERKEQVEMISVPVVDNKSEEYGRFTQNYCEDSKKSEEKQLKMISPPVDINKSEENSLSTHENHEDSEESEEKEQVAKISLTVDVSENDENGRPIHENLEDSKEFEDKEEVEMISLPVDVNKSEENSHFTPENRDDFKEFKEKEQVDQLLGISPHKNLDDFKESEQKEEVDQLLGISPDDLNSDVYSTPDSSLNSNVVADQIHSFLAEKDQKQQAVLHDSGDISPCDLSNVQCLDNSTESNIQDKIEQLNEQIDISEPKFDHSHSQQLYDSPTINTHLQGLKSSPESYSPPVSENLPKITIELLQKTIHDFNQVKHQSSSLISGIHLPPQLPPVKPEETPPLPPLPPMQWRLRKLQNSLSTPDGQHGHDPFPPFFPSAPIEDHQIVTRSKEDEITNLDAEHSDENMMPKAAVENISTSSDQLVFWPSSFPPDVDEMQNTFRAMKIQRPRSPLIEAVAAHDKSKLRKVSDRETTQMLKGNERDNLLNQIRAKSFNLKPAVQTRPGIQGPKTNLKLAAILQKANAIRQAFAGSDDDDDDDDDTWSDS